MGAEFNTLKVDSTDRLAIRKAFDSAQSSDLHDNGHSYSGGIGMAEGLEFKDKTFETYQDAETWLCDNAQKWENALAVTLLKHNKKYTLIGAWCSS
jgi:hypothetical protein